MLISHHLPKNQDFSSWDALLIELLPGSYIPFFIESIRRLNDQDLLCRLEEIGNREEARKLLNKAVFTSVNYSIKEPESASAAKYVGYTLYDGDVALGTIASVVQSGSNEWFILPYEGKEIMIPAVNDLIEYIHPPTKIIRMHLPEGMLEL